MNFVKVILFIILKTTGVNCDNLRNIAPDGGYVFFDNKQHYSLRKCCKEDEILNLSTKGCSPSFELNPFNFSFLNIVHVPENQICSEGKFKIKISEKFIIENGVLLWDELRFVLEDFCLIPSDNRTFAIVCVFNEDTLVEKALGGLGQYNESGQSIEHSLSQRENSLS